MKKILIMAVVAGAVSSAPAQADEPLCGNGVASFLARIIGVGCGSSDVATGLGDRAIAYERGGVLAYDGPLGPPLAQPRDEGRSVMPPVGQQTDRRTWPPVAQQSDHRTWPPVAQQTDRRTWPPIAP